MKLEYEENEQEFKNQAKETVNNAPQEVVDGENKSLSSGIYESKKTK